MFGKIIAYPIVWFYIKPRIKKRMTLAQAERIASAAPGPKRDKIAEQVFEECFPEFA